MHGKKNKVLFLCTWFPNRNHPLSGLFIQRHADCLSQFSEIIVFSVQPDAHLQPFNVEIAETSRNGYKIITAYYGLPPLTNITKYFQIIRAYIIGITHIKKLNFQYNVIHANVIIHAGVVGTLLSKWKKIPLIITEHASIYLKENYRKANPFFYQLSAWVGKNAKRILTVSKALSLGMQAHGITGSYEIISNAVDIKAFHPLPQAAKSTTFTFLHISGLTHSIKNPEGIMEAAKMLAKKNLSFKLKIAGSAQKAKKLKQFARDIQLAPELIEYYGTLTEKEVTQMMQNAHCFVLFSNFETQSCVLLEALCCGLPVIATNVGGIPEVINHAGLGILVPPRDTQQLASAMERMISEQDSFIPGEISKMASSRYALDKIAQDFRAIYQSL
jgi:glycosyltransferase involved in cell wall biosynthesis